MLKFYPLSKKEIDKEADKLDISVSNAKDIIYYFLSLYKRYVLGRLVLLVDTGSGKNKIFWRVYHIQIAYMHHETHGYFRLIGIGNLGNQILPNPFGVLALQNLDNYPQEVQNFYDRVRSDTTANEIEGSITKTDINKLRLH